MSDYSIIYSAVVSGTASSGAAGDVLIPDTNSQYVKATTANRGTRRATGIALTAYTAGGVVDIQQFGQIATTLTGFTAAAASWVRTSATGTLEKVTPSAGDDLLGKVDTDGRFFLDPGKWDSTNYTASAVATPTGTGLPHIVGGVQNAASSLIVNADVDAAAAIAASKVVQATGTGIPHVVAGALSAASSLIVNADVSASAAIAASKVVQATGTGIPHVVAGALSAASSLIVDADVATGAAIAGAKVAPDFGSQAVTTTGSALLGATPRATVGTVRLPRVGTFYWRNEANAADIQGISLDVSNRLVFGETDYYRVTPAGGDGSSLISGEFVYGVGAGQSHIFNGSAGALYLSVGPTISSAKPIVGNAANTSPYGVHGKTSIATAAPFTVAAADYIYGTILLSEATAGAVTFPLPATAAEAYQKFVINTGAGTKTIGNGGSVPTTVALTAGQAASILFDTRGAHARVPPFAYTE